MTMLDSSDSDVPYRNQRVSVPTSSTPVKHRKNTHSKKSPRSASRRDQSLRTSDTESLSEEEETKRYRLTRISLNRVNLPSPASTPAAAVVSHPVVDRIDSLHPPPITRSTRKAPSTSSSTLVDHAELLPKDFYTSLKSPERLEPVLEQQTSTPRPTMSNNLQTSAGSMRIQQAFDRILRNSASPPPIPDHIAAQEEDPIPSSSKYRISPRFGQQEWDLQPKYAHLAKDRIAAQRLSHQPESDDDSLALAHQDEDHQQQQQPHFLSRSKSTRTPSRSFAASYRAFDSPKTPHPPGHYFATPFNSKISNAQIPSDKVGGRSRFGSGGSLGRRKRGWSAASASLSVRPDSVNQEQERGKEQEEEEKEDVLSMSLSRVRLEQLDGEQQEVDNERILSGLREGEGKEQKVYKGETGLSALHLPKEEEQEGKSSLRTRLSKKKSSTEAAQLALSQAAQAYSSKSEPLDEALLQAISEAQRLDVSLKIRSEEVQRTVEEIGLRVGARISEAVDSTLQVESKRRTRWILWAIGAEFAIVFCLYSLAAAQARHEYQTSYYDPFYPALHEYASYPTPARFDLPTDTMTSWSIPDGRSIASSWSALGSYVVNVIQERWTSFGMDEAGWIVPT